MSIFSRLFKIGQAATNKAIDNLESPELMLDQAIRDKDKQIRETKQAVMACIAEERRTKALMDKETTAQQEWESKAEQALMAGKEDLAAKALTRSAEYEQRVTAMSPQWESQRKSVDDLKKDIRTMEEELAEFKRNKSFILAQSKAATVKKQIYEAKAKASKSNSADDLMARLKAKAETATYEADAAKEMADDLSGGDSLEKEFAGLENESVAPGVQDKLAAMKAKLNKQ